MKDNKKISVIIPMYNAESTIIRALNSIKNQTISKEKLEIIIINDGATDNSKTTVQKFIKENPNLTIILLHQENKGVSAARNAGLRIATGDFIALLDADDEWLPNKTERQLTYLKEQNPKMDFIASRFNDKKLLFPYATTEKLSWATFRKLLFRNEILPSTVIFKRNIIEDNLFFDENQRYAEDVHYWLRLSQKYKLCILNENLVTAGGGKRSFGVSGLSANLKAMAKGFQKNLKDMYLAKRISFVEWQAYMLLYHAKYHVLRWRTWYHKNISKR